jgi:heterodisulfide reductase subunit A
LGKDEKVGAVLVVGGGIGGMQAALDLAESGYKVYLLERKSSIGGVMSQLDKTFPTNDCAMCTMAPRLVEVGRHLNIELIVNAELSELKGGAGNFTATIRKKTGYVIEEKCTGCGLCAQNCPMEAIDAYNMGLAQRASVYVLYPQAMPLIYTIDKEKCIGCGLCAKVCGNQAIDYTLSDKLRELKVGAVILSPGFELFNPETQVEYGYGRLINVVTSLEFERIMSASGPYRGKILRPSDGRMPKKIAFIQCVGSREKERNYCSSVCCMYATKHTIIAKEHTPGLECHVFYIDLRAFSKGFDAYYERAKEIGVKYTRCKPSSIKEVPGSKNLKLRYRSDEGEEVEEEFDMVVLSSGLQPHKDIRELSAKVGIELDEYGFCRTGKFSPLETNREGVFVCGPFSDPKDIPETVTQASGSAAKSINLLAGRRGTLVTKKEYPPEIDVSGQEPRIGVFVCHCGTNIGGFVDVPSVVEYAKGLPDVVHAEENLYTCSTDTQEKIKQMIKEHNLNRVIVASCTPRTHEPLFQETIREAGLNPYLFEMANIRDQCSWVHMHEPEKGTEKSKALVRAAVGRARHIEPLYKHEIPLNRDALVIGGGAAGMVAALDLARQGFKVNLVEKEGELGGNLRNIYHTITGEDPQEYLKQLREEVTKSDLIEVHTATEVTGFSGFKGNFKATLSAQGEQQKEIDAGIVIVATGGKEYDGKEYLYGEDERVKTQLELEELIFTKREQIEKLKELVMIQCVGSRNEERPYCSRICCTEAIKNALKIKEINPEARIYILYRDIRTYGFRERYYREAREKGIFFLRYDENEPPEVTINKGELEVKLKEQMLKMPFVLNPDLLVLSMAILPHPDNKKLAPLLKIALNQDNFFLEAHMKLRPIDFASDGLFLCGLAHYPKFIDESIAQASATVARANTILSKDSLSVGGTVSVVDEDLCAACMTCVRACPYDVPVIRDGVAYIEVAACQGCGICAAACPAGAIQLMHYRDEQITTKCDELLLAAG